MWSLAKRVLAANINDQLKHDDPDDTQWSSYSGADVAQTDVQDEHRLTKNTKNVPVYGRNVVAKASDIALGLPTGINVAASILSAGFSKATGVLTANIKDQYKNNDPDDTQRSSDSGADVAQTNVEDEHKFHKNTKNVRLFGKDVVAKASDIASGPPMGINVAARILSTGLISKATGLLTNEDSEDSGDDSENVEGAKEHWLYRNKRNILIYGGAAAAGVGAVVAAPVVLSAAGFCATGISSGSLGAVIMSKAATSRIGMWVVSALQSAGAAGISTSTSVLIGATVGGGVVVAAGATEENQNVDDDEPNPSKPGDKRKQTKGITEAATENEKQKLL